MIMDDLRLYSVTGGIQALGDDPDALYVSVYGMGVYRYVASENNWQAVNSGLASLEISVLHSDGKSLWAVAQDGLWRLMVINGNLSSCLWRLRGTWTR